MQMMILVVAIIIYTVFLDVIWIGVISKNLYLQEIGTLLRKSGEQLSPNWVAASLVYLAIALGIVYFVLPKSEDNVVQAILWGGLFGVILYGVYDFTNMSVLMNWTWKISIIDVLWGAVLCSTASAFAVLVRRWLGH